MKILHTSDLHIGKRVNEFSMLDDQRHILNEILGVVKDERPDALIIAGDVYDKSIPSAEAVTLFDKFLLELSALALPTFIISGNHDSPERLGFASELIGGCGIHIHGVYEGALGHFTLTDRYGPVNFYTLPFVKPTHVRRYFPEADIESYTDAVRTALDGCPVRDDERNILVTHQFVTGASRTESEECSVGGTDNVDAEVFSRFDYVALGHIHRVQRAGGENIRYSGSPLKYSFSEAGDKKSVTVIELFEKGEISVREIGLTPLTDMAEIRGEYNEVISKSFYEGKDFRDAYLRVTLTDETDIPDAISRLRTVYKNIMLLQYDNTRTRYSSEIGAASDVEEKSPLTLFTELFEAQNGRAMTAQELACITKYIEEVWR
ncbi:MAG: exonuclease SbcCD subunit D [Clostridia bacterium]|nr:exonuclease SbcCD subunit D [Clostridia bacterium]